MLGQRVIALLETVMVMRVEKSCPQLQEEILFSFLWCLVADGLLKTLNNKRFFAQQYANDMAILVRGPFLKPLLKLT